jgi:menaquinone-dependent protoporphyrinogen oxidase
MRVLIIPASKYGSTAEIGRAMANTLRERGMDVDVSQPQHMFDLSPYGAHIIGSALYLGNWLDQASEFVNEYQDGLRANPTWLFSSGPLGPARPDVPVNHDVIDRLMAMTDAREHRLFSGRLDVDRLSRSERFIAKWVGATDGDYREWDEIERWAAGIADELTPASDRVIDGIGRDHR